MKVWITKYCLTIGIEEIEAEICSTNEDMIEKVNNKEISGYQCDEYYHGKNEEWHTTKESAIKKAEEMKLKKINSLKKQLKKLEALKFD